jgi:hypothetical protein
MSFQAICILWLSIWLKKKYLFIYFGYPWLSIAVLCEEKKIYIRVCFTYFGRIWTHTVFLIQYPYIDFKRQPYDPVERLLHQFTHKLTTWIQNLQLQFAFFILLIVCRNQKFIGSFFEVLLSEIPDSNAFFFLENRLELFCLRNKDKRRFGRSIWWAWLKRQNEVDFWITSNIIFDFSGKKWFFK